MATIDISLDVICDECRSSLDTDQRDGEVRIVPCQKCKDEAKKEGYDEGYTTGQDDVESK